MTEPLLELDHVTVRYRLARGEQVHAVEDVSLQIARGEVYGLVGESGCGKSTIVRCAAGLDAPTGGSVRFDGMDVWAMPRRTRRTAVAHRVGLVFQDPASSLNPRLSVREVVADPLRIHGEGDRVARARAAAELIELVGLQPHLLERRARELSGGQRQRVAIARALALRPSLLVADEPTSALDVSTQNQILALIERLQQELGLAVLFISHNIHAVNYLADRIGVMYLGHLVEEGPAAEVHSAPSHPYTRALLSASPRLDGRAPRLVLRGTVPSARRPPGGCPFRTRCWKAQDVCAESFPPPAGPAGHLAWCYFPEEPGAMTPSLPAGSTTTPMAVPEERG